MRRAAAGAALVLVAAAAAWWRLRAPPPAPKAPPSILLVTIDTLRTDRVGAYGSTAGATPNLDALARRGVVFEEALSSVPLTLPSHATLLSGLEPPHHGVRDNGLYVFPATLDTLATRLHAHGYATGAFVGAYVLDRRFGLARGFDAYDDRIERREERAGGLESERPCAEVVGAATSWIAGRSGPFLAWAHFYEPHAPYDPRPPFRDRFAGRPYEGDVAGADACLGDLVRAAEERAPGRLVVAVTADHGEALGEHGERTHGWFVYDATLRVPLVLTGPGLPAGERRAGTARLVDLSPTLLALAGAPPLEHADGRNLLAGPLPREAYAESLYPRSLGFAPLYSYRVGWLKLVDAPRPEMYDLVADPREERNLMSERSTRAEPLRQALQRVLAAQKDAASVDDPEVAERLRALGYVATAAPGAGRGAPSALEEDPKDGLAAWHQVEDAVAAEARGQGSDATRLLREALAARPKNAALRRLLASALRREGAPAEAARVLADLSPDAADAVAWHEKALAEAAAGRVAEAQRSEERAIALNPTLPEPRNHLGVLLAQGGRLDEALRAFDEAVRLDPNSARAWNNRANALRGAGRAAEAREAYERAQALAPADPDPKNGLGVLAVESGDLAEAERLFRDALAADAGYAEARLNLAVVLVKAGRTSEARATLEQLLRSRAPADVQARAKGLLSTL